MSDTGRSALSSVRWPSLAVLLLLHVLPFAVRPALIGGDEPHYALAAHSLAIDGDIELENNYRQVEAGAKAAGRKRSGESLERHVRAFGDRVVFTHPLGLPLLVAPLLKMQQMIAPGSSPDLLLAAPGLILTFLALLQGLELVGAVVGDVRRAVLAALLVYFATPLWYYSRTFLTEPYLWSLTVLALGSLRRGRELAASALLGLSFLIKETALLSILPILLYVGANSGLRRAARLALGPALALVAYCCKNLLVYGQLWETFQPFQFGSPLSGARGLLFDLEHGLVMFAPVVVWGVAGWIVSRPERPRLENPTLFALAIFVAYYLTMALWVDWGGGASYGPRLLVPALPALALPTAVLLARLEARNWALWVLAMLAIGGFTVQWCAVTDPVPAFWSIPITDLLTRRPVTTASGVLIGSALVLVLLRNLRQPTLRCDPRLNALW